MYVNVVYTIMKSKFVTDDILHSYYFIFYLILRFKLDTTLLLSLNK